MPIFIFFVNLFNLGFLYIAGYQLLTVTDSSTTVSFLMKYGALSLASAVFLPNFFKITRYVFFKVMKLSKRLSHHFFSHRKK